jgi:hypothetical protein
MKHLKTINEFFSFEDRDQYDNGTLIIRNIDLFNNQKPETHIFKSGPVNMFKNVENNPNWDWTQANDLYDTINMPNNTFDWDNFQHKFL